MSLRLLIVDEEAAAAWLAEQLSIFGHGATLAHDGRAAIGAIGRDAFDAIILERMLPHGDGIAVVRSLREGRIATPIVMLSVLGQPAHKVEGLNAGADDYVVKPADPAELDARIRALIRARHWQETLSDESIRAGDIVISPARHAAWRGGRPLVLQHVEFKMLLALARHANNAVSRTMLLEQVWSTGFAPETNLVEAHIRRLRRKLTALGDDPIATIRGVGYMLRA